MKLQKIHDLSRFTTDETTRWGIGNVRIGDGRFEATNGRLIIRVPIAAEGEGIGYIKSDELKQAVKEGEVVSINGGVKLGKRKLPDDAKFPDTDSLMASKSVPDAVVCLGVEEFSKLLSYAKENKADAIVLALRDVPDGKRAGERISEKPIQFAFTVGDEKAPVVVGGIICPCAVEADEVTQVLGLTGATHAKAKGQPVEPEAKPSKPASKPTTTKKPAAPAIQVTATAIAGVPERVANLAAQIQACVEDERGPSPRRPGASKYRLTLLNKALDEAGNRAAIEKKIGFAAIQEAVLSLYSEGGTPSQAAGDTKEIEFLAGRVKEEIAANKLGIARRTYKKLIEALEGQNGKASALRKKFGIDKLGEQLE